MIYDIGICILREKSRASYEYEPDYITDGIIVIKKFDTVMKKGKTNLTSKKYLFSK